MRSARQGRSLVAALLGLALFCPTAMAIEAPKGLLGVQVPLGWEASVERLSRSDVVFLGEQHADPATHRLERSLLEALHLATRKRLILSLEMFERDVQPVLDAYLRGAIPESEFLEKSRPWPNYARDYRPLIEYAKENGIPVVAANVPRRLASRVAKDGLKALQAMPPEERQWAAKTVDCPKDRLWDRFRETIHGHPGVNDEVIERMYQAQCLKDATMAEAIALAFGPAAPPTLVLHLNGAFHSDEGLGVPAQLKQREAQLVQTVTTVRPVGPSEPPPPAGVADLVFLVDPEKP